MAPPEKRDQAGFDDIDSYFSPQKEAKENKSSDWTVTKTPLKNSAKSKLQREEKAEEVEEEIGGEYEEYTLPIAEDNYDYAPVEQHESAEPLEAEEEEISFGAKVITSPLSTNGAATSPAGKSPVATKARVSKASKPKKQLVSPRLLAESGTEGNTPNR